MISGMPKNHTTRLSPPPLDLSGPTSDLFAKIKVQSLSYLHLLLLLTLILKKLNF